MIAKNYKKWLKLEGTAGQNVFFKNGVYFGLLFKHKKIMFLKIKFLYLTIRLSKIDLNSGDMHECKYQP